MTSTLDIKNTQQWSVPSNGKIYFSFGLNNSTWVNPLNFDENSKAEIVNKIVFVSALGNWDRYINGIVFEENNTSPSITFFKVNFVSTTSNGSTLTLLNGTEIQSSEIAIKTSLDIINSNEAYSNAVHEIGHALGLRHPNDNGFDPNYNTDITIMSYDLTAGRYAITPMALDIKAIDEKYGTISYNTTNTNYEYVVNGPTLDQFNGTLRKQTIVDTSGTDEFDLTGFTGDAKIDLRKSLEVNGTTQTWHPDRFTEIDDEHIFIAHNTVIENATGGSGNDNFIGNSENNIFDGGAGIDTVDYGSNPQGITVSPINVNGGNGDIDTLLNIEIVKGTGFDDTFTFSYLSSSLQEIDAGAGYDTVFVNAPPDFTRTIKGGSGFDIVDYSGGNYSIDVVPDGNAYRVYMGVDPSDPNAKYDILYGIEKIIGTDYADYFEFGTQNIVFEGKNSGTSVDVYKISAGIGTVGDTMRSDNVIIDPRIGPNNLNRIISDVNYYPYGHSLDNTSGKVNSGGGITITHNSGSPTIQLYKSNSINEIRTPNVNTSPSAYLDAGAGTLTWGTAATFSPTLVADPFLGTANNYDTVDYSSSRDSVIVDLSSSATGVGGSAEGDSYTSIESVIGSDIDEEGDTLIGIASGSELYGLRGDDLLFSGLGNDLIVGGDGIDTVSYASANAGVTINLETVIAQNTVGAGTDTLSAIESITGSAFNDTLTGNAEDNTIDGGSGNDLIQGGTGNDTLNGGDGTDTLSYVSATSGVTVNLETLSAQNTIGAGTDTLSNFENLIGSSFDDTLNGNTLANNIDGGDANDLIQGGLGNDALDGGAGIDTASYASASAGVTVNLETLTGQNTVGAGTDTLSNFENLIGSGFNDTLNGNALANIITGGVGNDTLKGRDGNDTIYGGDGNDTIEGNNGDDIIYGGLGADTIKGSSNVDTFVYLSVLEGGDTIQDFNINAGEKIDLMAIMQNIAGFEGAQAFTAGYIQKVQNGTSTEVYVDLDGSAGGGGQTLLATVQNVTASNLTLSSFILPVSVPGGGNLPPTAQNDTANTNEDTAVQVSVLANDSDPNGNPLSVSILTGATSGTLQVNGNNTVTYTPNANYNGIDSFTYQINDGQGGTSSATVSLTITAVNDAPVANNDSASTNEDTAVTVSVLGNDTDIENNPLTVTILTNAASGALVVNGNNTITYTPNGNYYGTDSFTYQMSDGQGGTSSATVSLTVNSVNDAPLAVDDVFTGTQNTNITGNLLSNNGNGVDSDVDGGTLSVTAQTVSTAHGSVTILANGNFTYTPTTGYTGADSFSYSLSDGQGGSDTGSVALTINPAGIYGTNGNDTITGTAGNDFIYGLDGTDNLYGEAGNDTIYGDAGNDTLKGRDGNDTLYGGDGADYIEGNNNDDILIGGAGADTLKGSTGVDTFVFTSMADAGDTIQDYNYSAVEKIDIADLLIGYDPLTEAITDFVQITDNGTNSFLSVDSDGGANNFIQIATISAVLNLTDEEALETSGRLITV